MAVLNDCRYADYYIRVTRSQQVTIGLTLFVVSFSMYGLLDNIAGPLVFWMFAFAGFYYYGNLASETIKKRSEEMLTDFSNRNGISTTRTDNRACEKGQYFSDERGMGTGRI